VPPSAEILWPQWQARIAVQTASQTPLALSSLLEPIIIVFLGVVIGGLVVAMYLPIFKLVTIMK
jgi:type II secretory pathway component PulF